MWKRLKDLKYPTIIKYYFLGIVLAVIIYQFVTKSMNNDTLFFHSLIEKNILKHIIAALIGGFVGGYVFILMTINKVDRQIKEELLWRNLKKNNLLFFIKNLITFSIAGFSYQLIGNLFNLKNYDNLIQSLFANNLIIEYIGIIAAASVFSIFISIGLKKRLELVFNN